MTLTRRWAANSLAGLLLLPLVCGITCRLGINPADKWMMRHDCPFAMLPASPRPLPSLGAAAASMR